MVKNPPAKQKMQETQVQSLGQENPLEEEMANHSSILAWKNSMDRGTWQATVHVVAKSQTQLSSRALTTFNQGPFAICYMHFSINLIFPVIKIIFNEKVMCSGIKKDNNNNKIITIVKIRNAYV